MHATCIGRSRILRRSRASGCRWNGHDFKRSAVRDGGRAFLHLLAVQRSLPKEAKFHQARCVMASVADDPARQAQGPSNPERVTHPVVSEQVWENDLKAYLSVMEPLAWGSTPVESWGSTPVELPYARSPFRDQGYNPTSRLTGQQVPYPPECSQSQRV
jgi:hypothetical protein